MRTLNGKILTFDVDGVVANTKGNDYKNSVPFEFAIKHINKAYDLGYTILLFTARYGSRCKGNIHEIYNKGFLELKEWCDKHGIKYDNIYLSKPVSSLFIDDRAVKVESLKGEDDWINNFWPAVENLEMVDEYNQSFKRSELVELGEKVKDI